MLTFKILSSPPPNFTKVMLRSSFLSFTPHSSPLFPSPPLSCVLEKAIEDEKARVLSYLNSETESKLLKVLEEEVLEKREAALLEKEVRNLVTFSVRPIECKKSLSYQLHAVL